MTDLALDVYGDLDYQSGDLVLVNELDELMQSLKIALRTGLGEWSFDTDAGVGYRSIIFEKGASLETMAAELRRVVLAVDGVTEVRDITPTPDYLTRALTVAITVATIYGEAGEIVIVT